MPTGHYDRKPRKTSIEKFIDNVRVCSVDDCNRKHKGRGYCATHLYRLKTHGDAGVVLPTNRGGICKVVGCDKKNHGQGYCKIHYSKLVATPRIQNNPALRERVRESQRKSEQRPERKERKQEIDKRRRFNDRIRVIKMIGTKCASCGEKVDMSNPQNLEFHHKYYDDYDEKFMKKYGRNPSNYKQVLDIASNGINPKKKFELLCHQCNVLEAFVRTNPKKAWDAIFWLIEHNILDADLLDEKGNRKLTEFLK